MKTEQNPLPFLLRDAAGEIQRLRRQNEILSAKVEVMNLFAVVLHTAPAYPPQGASLDVAWQLEKAAGEIENPPQPTIYSCPCCGSAARVTVSPKPEYGEFFCPCNEPGPQYFNRDGSGTIVTPAGPQAVLPSGNTFSK